MKVVEDVYVQCSLYLLASSLPLTVESQTTIFESRYHVSVSYVHAADRNQRNCESTARRRHCTLIIVRFCTFHRSQFIGDALKPGPVRLHPSFTPTVVDAAWSKSRLRSDSLIETPLAARDIRTSTLPWSRLYCRLPSSSFVHHLASDWPDMAADIVVWGSHSGIVSPSWSLQLRSLNADRKCPSFHLPPRNPCNRQRQSQPSL